MPYFGGMTNPTTPDTDLTLSTLSCVADDGDAPDPRVLAGLCVHLAACALEHLCRFRATEPISYRVDADAIEQLVIDDEEHATPDMVREAVEKLLAMTPAERYVAVCHPFTVTRKVTDRLPFNYLTDDELDARGLGVCLRTWDAIMEPVDRCTIRVVRERCVGRSDNAVFCVDYPNDDREPSRAIMASDCCETDDGAQCGESILWFVRLCKDFTDDGEYRCLNGLEWYGLDRRPGGRPWPWNPILPVEWARICRFTPDVFQVMRPDGSMPKYTRIDDAVRDAVTASTDSDRPAYVFRVSDAVTVGAWTYVRGQYVPPTRRTECA